MAYDLHIRTKYDYSTFNAPASLNAVELYASLSRQPFPGLEQIDCTQRQDAFHAIPRRLDRLDKISEQIIECMVLLFVL